MADRDVFLDTSYAIALSSATDGHHQVATTLAAELLKSSARMVTTRAILLEIGNALAGTRYRRAAATLLDALEQDETVEIVDLTREYYGKALELFRGRADKEWGLIDCLSFVVMSERGLVEALTTTVS